GSGGGLSSSVYAYDTAFKASQVGGDPLPAGTGNPFYTFCMDISADIIPSDWWQSGAFPSGDNRNGIPWTPGGVYRAASLYNHYVGEVSFDTSGGKQAGAALQLAIWNVLYGSAVSDNNWDISAQTFGASGYGFQVVQADSGVVALANQMLNSSANKVDLNLQF